MVELLSQGYYTKYVIDCHWIFGITQRYIFAMNILFYQVKMAVFYKFKQPILTFVDKYEIYSKYL